MNDQSYQPLCLRCEENGDETLAVHVVHLPWGREDLCESCYDKAGEASAGREPDYGAVGVTEFCARALADKQRNR